MIQRISLLLIAFITSLAPLMGQEVMTGLFENTAIIDYLQKNQFTKSTPQVHQLPFFDDFSGRGVYPNQQKWTDNKTFINSDYPIFPPTIGVATFDAIDENGKLYPAANTARFIADYLTSQPIRLDSVFAPVQKALSPSDSVFLSFYYQPEGYGFAPDAGDSLVLEFYCDHPVDSLKHWRWIWSSPGMSLNTFFAQYNAYFRQVVIPITDSCFFRPGFRFRFYNYASILYPTVPSRQSNRDHWHIDYIYLDINRSSQPSPIPDIAFVNKPGSVLKNYYEMPYRQYKQNFINELRDTLQITVTNLATSPTQGSYKYIVRNEAGNQIKTYESGIHLFPSFWQSGYVSQQPIAKPPVNFVFPTTSQQYAAFTIQHILTSHSGFEPSPNDTSIFVQKFWDYLAYDDGSNEAGYGLNFAGSQAAYRFKLNSPDTLAAVLIFFNRTLNNANQKYFHLKIWNEIASQPGMLRYTEENLLPRFSNGLNRFERYELSQPLVISNTDFPGLVFYIGWEQISSDLLNIGFDRNTNSKTKLFYNLGGSWYNSMLDGSLMMRPVMGYKGPSGTDHIPPSNALAVFPNPVHGNTISLKSGSNYLKANKISIYDTKGCLVMEAPFGEVIDISPLTTGMYFIRIVSDHHNNPVTTKFSVIR